MLILTWRKWRRRWSAFKGQVRDQTPLVGGFCRLWIPERKPREERSEIQFTDEMESQQTQGVKNSFN